jgi:hypothetical protein
VRGTVERRRLSSVRELGVAVTDAQLMDAPCVHGEVWHECARCQFTLAMRLTADMLGWERTCEIVADELRDMGYVVVRGVVDVRGPDEYEGDERGDE